MLKLKKISGAISQYSMLDMCDERCQVDLTILLSFFILYFLHIKQEIKLIFAIES